MFFFFFICLFSRIPEIIVQLSDILSLIALVYGSKCLSMQTLKKGIQVGYHQMSPLRHITQSGHVCPH